MRYVDLKGDVSLLFGSNCNFFKVVSDYDRFIFFESNVLGEYPKLFLKAVEK